MKDGFILEEGTWFLFVGTPLPPPSNSEWNEQKNNNHLVILETLTIQYLFNDVEPHLNVTPQGQTKSGNR